MNALFFCINLTKKKKKKNQLMIKLVVLMLKPN